MDRNYYYRNIKINHNVFTIFRFIISALFHHALMTPRGYFSKSLFSNKSTE